MREREREREGERKRGEGEVWVGLPLAHQQSHAAKSCDGTPEPTGSIRPHTQLGDTCMSCARACVAGSKRSTPCLDHVKKNIGGGGGGKSQLT